MSRHVIDAHLLKTLHTLITESSVSRTALLLGQSQPTVSVALRRLRAITGDPLRVRSGSRMVPTSHAMTLVEPLAGIAAVLNPASKFDPATTPRTFRIGSPDYLDVFFLPAIVDAFKHEAPGARIEFQHLMTVDGGYEHALENGALDLAVGNWSTPAHLRHATGASTPGRRARRPKNRVDRTRAPSSPSPASMPTRPAPASGASGPSATASSPHRGR